jgi:hypothetical protein
MLRVSVCRSTDYVLRLPAQDATDPLVYGKLKSPIHQLSGCKTYLSRMFAATATHFIISFYSYRFNAWLRHTHIADWAPEKIACHQPRPEK